MSSVRQIRPETVEDARPWAKKNAGIFSGVAGRSSSAFLHCGRVVGTTSHIVDASLRLAGTAARRKKWMVGSEFIRSTRNEGSS